MPETPANAPTRRTQAQRREATRAALLDAALLSLVQDGYANLTTRGVAERAGVSQGTQQHYFQSKAQFVGEAMRHAARQTADELAQRIDLSALADPARHEALLDEIWRVHQGPAFQASIELWNAARTDPELLAHMQEVEQEITGIIGGAAATLPAGAVSQATRELFDLALASVRGYAMLSPVVPDALLAKRWRVARGHIATALRASVER